MRTKAKMLINSDNLELVDSETLESCRQVYREAQTRGGVDLFDAQIQLAYAMSHSDRQENVSAAQRLAGELLARVDRTQQDTWKHVLYIHAVADYRLGHYSHAKEKLRALVLSPAGHRQAQRLLDEVEDRILKEGLIGAGVIGAGVLGLGLIAGALFGGRSSRS